MPLRRSLVFMMAGDRVPARGDTADCALGSVEVGFPAVLTGSQLRAADSDIGGVSYRDRRVDAGGQRAIPHRASRFPTSVYLGVL
jgi:hypothetical protein